MKQNEAVVKALENLGGIASLGQLYKEVLTIEDCVWKTKTPFASIRRIVQLDKNVYKIKPGLYGLLKYKKDFEGKGIIAETEKNRKSKEVMEFNHYYYQGMVIMVGNLKGLDTFSPNQDKNKKYVNQKLGDVRTLQSIPNFSYPELVQRCSNIDVIWFNARKMPHSFFEVENETDIQNSLLKFNDLLDFHARMIIVADKSRKKEFEHKLQYSAFGSLKKEDRVKFIDYEALARQYESLVQNQKFDLIL